MPLAGLLDCVVADPALASAVEAARTGVRPSSTSSPRPACGRSSSRRWPPAPAGRCWPSRPPAARPRTSPTRCAACCPPSRSCRVPGLGDAAARAALPAQRHRRPPAGGAAPARPPQRRRPGHRAGAGRRRAGPQPAAAPGGRPRRPGAGRAAHRRPTSISTTSWTAGRGGLHPGRPGGEARRVRRPRRHPRRVPADRGAPGPGGVLGRHGRGGPLLQGRRPALARRSPSTACGRRRAVSCCSPTTVRERAEALAAEHPGLADILDEDRRRHRRGGHGGARAGARRRHAHAAGRARRPGRTSCSATRSGSAPARPSWSRPARSSSTRPGRPPRPAGTAPDRPGAGGLPQLDRRPRRTPATHGMPWWTLTPFALDAETSDRGAGTLEVIDARDAEAYRGDTERAHGRRQGLARRAAGGSCWSPRGTARPSGWWRCCAMTTSPARLDPDLPRRPTRRWCTSPPAVLDHGFVMRGATASRCSPRPTSPARSPPPRTCAGCRSGAATRSTRCSCEPATTSCTSSTASAGTWRWCSAPCRARPASTWSLEYAPAKRGQPGDRLFVPTDQLDQVTRYVGGEAPALHRLGGADWAKAKGRARKAVRQIAAELIRLYSARMAAPGTPSARTRRGSASWRTPSRTSRRPTRPAPSTRSRPTWNSRSRWTG